MSLADISCAILTHNETELSVAMHAAQTPVTNPMDYNRAQIRGLVSLITDMYLAIQVAPENFAAVDLSYLQSNLEALTQEIADTTKLADWTLVKS